MAVETALKIFYGPPGCGKTYAAAREAVRLIDGKLPEDTSGIVDQDAVGRRYRELVSGGRIWFVTFHPSYTYEDFVEGYRPDQSTGGTIVYRLRNGPFKQACDVCRGRRDRRVRPGDILTEGRGSWTVEAVTGETVTLRASTVNATQTRKIVPWQIVDTIIATIRAGGISLDDLNIPKGKQAAKTHRARVAAATDINAHHLSDQGPLRALVKREMHGFLHVGQMLGDYVVTRISDEGVVVRSTRTRTDAVVSNWEQFVPFWLIDRLTGRGITPEEVSIAGKDYERKGQVANRAGVSVSYMGEMGPVRAVWEAIRSSPRTNIPIVLVIDEINRADLSRVFGELLTLLELDKRDGMPEATSVFLPYSKSLFTVPSELSIIGTMNTTDRSLSVIDYALRRRFEFVEVRAAPENCPTSYGGFDLRSILKTLNERITALRSREHQLGHAEFMRHKLDAVRQQRYPNATDGELRAVAWLFRHKVIPQVLDYFPENWKRAHVAFNDSALIEAVSPPTALLEHPAIGEDLDGVSSYELPSYDDPDHTSWDAAGFTQRLTAAFPGSVP